MLDSSKNSISTDDQQSIPAIHTQKVQKCGRNGWLNKLNLSRTRDTGRIRLGAGCRIRIDASKRHAGSV
jgi:hypothetical protein